MTPVAVPGASPVPVPDLPISGVTAQRVAFAAATNAGATGDIASAVGSAASGAAGARTRFRRLRWSPHIFIRTMHHSACVRAVDAKRGAFSLSGP